MYIHIYTYLYVYICIYIYVYIYIYICMDMHVYVLPNGRKSKHPKELNKMSTKDISLVGPMYTMNVFDVNKNMWIYIHIYERGT